MMQACKKLNLWSFRDMTENARRTPLEFSQGGISRYSQLGTLFRRKVETGEWPLGEQIPTVDRLAEEYGVAVEVGEGAV